MRIIQWSFFYFQWDHYHVQCIIFLVLHSALFFSFSVQSPYVLPNSVSLLHSNLLHLPLLWPFPIFPSSSLFPSLFICLPYTSEHLQVLVLSLTNLIPPSSLSPALHLQLFYFCSPSFLKLWNRVGGAHILQWPLLFFFFSKRYWMWISKCVKIKWSGLGKKAVWVMFQARIKSGRRWMLERWALRK